MLLREYLEEHTRDELLDYARSIELKNVPDFERQN